MKIIFDSNVWRIVSSPDSFPNERSIADFKKIRGAIKAKVLVPFISETVFTIEAIKRKERKRVIGTSNAKVDVEEDGADDGAVQLTIAIGPKKGLDFGGNPILKRHFDDAVALGFQIVRLPRIAGFFNQEVDSIRFHLSGEALTAYQQKVFEVVKRIEDRGAGLTQVTNIGERFGTPWIEGIRKAPESEAGNIAKATAEWADADSIAICIALGCDYFCTRDQAKGAGGASVLSSSNLMWLESDYGLRIISPEALAKLV